MLYRLKPRQFRTRTAPRPPRTRRPLRALLTLTALLAAALAVVAPAALALSGAPATAPTDQHQTYGIQPASASGPDQRPSFTYLATPGAQVKDHVAVYNYGDDPLTLTLYAADAFNTASGGYDVLPAGKPSTDVGSWVRLAAGSFVLPPRTREIIPFTLAVPAQAGPGDHSGGIVLALRRQTVDAKGNVVTVDERVGTRIHLRIPGALRPGLTVESVSVHCRGTLNPFGTGSTTVSYTVRNTGNIRLGGHQAVRVRNVLGMVATAKGPSDLTELLPGNTATYSVQVPGVFPTLWSTASITVDPLALPGDTDPALASAVSDNDYATIPWTLLALLAPVLVLVVRALVRWRRRRRGGGTPSPFGPAAPGGGTPAMPPAPTAPQAPTSGPTAPTGGPASPVPVAVPVPGAAPTPTPEVPSPRQPAPTGATNPAAIPVTAPVPVPVPATSPASASGADPAAVPVNAPVPAPAGAAAPASASGTGPAAVPAVPVPSVQPAAAPEAAADAPVNAPAAAPAEAPAPATTVSRRATGVRPVLRGLGVGAMLVTSLFGGSAAAFADGSASATPAASGSATAGDTGPGVLWFDYAKGHDDDPVNVATSGRCPGQDDWVTASITGPGFPASGASALGLSAAKIYSPSSTGGYIVPLDQTLRAIARQNGVPQLRGAYRVDVFCRGRFNPGHLRDFYGTLTFGTGEAWTADRATAIAMPQSMEPPATAIPKRRPVAAPAPTGDEISPVSIVTMVAGGVLLLALGGQALKRRRAEVVAKQTDDRSPTPRAKRAGTKEKAAQR